MAAMQRLWQDKAYGVAGYQAGAKARETDS